MWIITVPLRRQSMFIATYGSVTGAAFASFTGEAIPADDALQYGTMATASLSSNKAVLDHG